MIVDCHVHYGAGDIAAFVAEAERNDMQACIFGAFDPDRYPSALGLRGNKEVIKTVKAYPDRLYAFAHVAPGRGVLPEDIERFHDHGFKGLKFIFPADEYDREEYFSLYEKAEARGMVCLFHTGIVSPDTCKTFRISSKHMHPLTLDAIARAFPDLKIIMAHLGIPFYDVGAMLIRIHKNMYADLSGSGIWGYIGAERLKNLLDMRVEGFEDAETYYHKLVFGSDAYVAHPGMPRKALEGYRRLFDRLDLDVALTRKIFSLNLISWMR